MTRDKPGHDEGRATTMIKIWGRNTSVNVQKVMWALGELGLPHERIDVGGTFGKNNEPAYLAMNPNGLVPTLEEDGFLLWESNSIVRYLAAKYGAGTLEPADLRAARARQQLDGLAAHGRGPRAHAGVLGPHSHAAGEARSAAIEAGKVKTMAAMKILDAQLAKSAFVAGDTLSMGDIPVALMAYRFRRLVPERPAARPSRALVRRHRAAPRVQRARAGDPVRVRQCVAFWRHAATAPRRARASAPRRRDRRPRG